MKVGDGKALMSAVKLGEKRGKMMVLARTAHEDLANQIFEKATEPKGTSTFIDRSLTKEEREIRNKLLIIRTNILIVEKSERIRVKRNRLIIGKTKLVRKKGELKCGVQ